MATRWLERVPMDRIAEKAEPVHLGRLLLTALVGMLYVLGWLAAKTLILLGSGLGWALAALRFGWQDAYASHEAAQEERRARGQRAA